MKKGNSLPIIVVASALSMLAGCKDKVQTVDWYKTHEKERKEILAKCADNPGELANEPNCLNAQKAASDLVWSARGGIHVKPLTFK